MSFIFEEHRLTPEERGKSRDELIYEALPPDASYDMALPQPWVDAMRDRGFDVRGHFVWLYDFKVPGLTYHDIFGSPFPITLYGRTIAWLVKPLWTS